MKIINLIFLWITFFLNQYQPHNFKQMDFNLYVLYHGCWNYFIDKKNSLKIHKKKLAVTVV